MDKNDHNDLLELANIIKQQCHKIKNHKDEVEEINGCADAIIEIVNDLYFGSQNIVKRMI
jgi:hypothetical protein